jgi:hypothetical protein
LVRFAREQAGKYAGEVNRVVMAPIKMNVDHVSMAASLAAGSEVEVQTRKLARTDCVCSNEENYYPPLVKVDNSAPAFSLKSSFSGRGLGVRWSNPMTRTANLATFGN